MVTTQWIIGGREMFEVLQYGRIPYVARDKRTKNQKSYERYVEQLNRDWLLEYQVYLTHLYLNCFTWNNLPGTVKPHVLEELLFNHGKCLFFRDDEVYRKSRYPTVDNTMDAKYWVTDCTLGEGINLWGEHVHRTAIGYSDTAYTKRYDITNSVLIKNNDSMYPSVLSVGLWADKLLKASRVTEMVAENLKRPFVLTADEAERLSVETYLNKSRSNVDSFIATKSFKPDTVQIQPAIPGGYPSALSAAWDHQHNVENEVYTRLGIDNARVDKKERLLTNEVEANNEIQSHSIYTLLETRQRACEEINTMFGLNVSVELNPELYANPDPETPPPKKQEEGVTGG